MKQCTNLVKRHTAIPLIVSQKQMRWSLINLAIGNAKAHSKNFSLLYSTTGTASRAPFFSLVCTHYYKNLSREIAISLGGVLEPSLGDLDGQANDLGTRTNAVIKETKELLERFATSLPIVIESYSQKFGESPVLQRLPIIIRKMLRRSRSQLK